MNPSVSRLPLVAAGLEVRDFAGGASFAFRRALAGGCGLGDGRLAGGPGEANGAGFGGKGGTGFTSGNCSLDARSIRRLLGVSVFSHRIGMLTGIRLSGCGRP